MSLIHASSKFIPGDGRGVVNRVRSKLFTAAERSQALVVAEAKALVPVDTGELRESITALPIIDDGQRVTAEVAATAEHAAYVEYGTGLRGMSSPGAGPFLYDQSWLGMPAQPYMRPAIDVAAKQVKQEFSR